MKLKNTINSLTVIRSNELLLRRAEGNYLCRYIFFVLDAIMVGVLDTVVDYFLITLWIGSLSGNLILKRNVLGHDYSVHSH